MTVVRRFARSSTPTALARALGVSLDVLTGVVESQPELADRVGVRTSTISNWERGKGEPQMSESFALADALEVTVDILAGRVPLPPLSRRED